MKKKREQAEEKEKKKEQKIIYIDDGSTVADMSGTFRRGKPQGREKSTFRERAKTFFGVMKKMVVPMLVTLIAFTLVYVILLAVTGKLF